MKKVLMALLVVASMAGIGTAAYAASGCCPGFCCASGMPCCE